MSDEKKQLLASLPLVVRWGDMDAIGHVNNIIYFQYFEQTRAHWLESVNLQDTISGKASQGPIIVNTSATYLQPVIYPANIVINMFGGTPSRSSFMTYYTITDKENLDIIYTTGKAKVVWVDHTMGKSCPVPDFVRDLLPKPQ